MSKPVTWVVMVTVELAGGGTREYADGPFDLVESEDERAKSHGLAPASARTCKRKHELLGRKAKIVSSSKPLAPKPKRFSTKNLKSERMFGDDWYPTKETKRGSHS